MKNRWFQIALAIVEAVGEEEGCFFQSYWKGVTEKEKRKLFTELEKRYRSKNQRWSIEEGKDWIDSMSK